MVLVGVGLSSQMPKFSDIRFVSSQWQKEAGTMSSTSCAIRGLFSQLQMNSTCPKMDIRLASVGILLCILGIFIYNAMAEEDMPLLVAARRMGGYAAAMRSVVGGSG
jgi:hypothetical protein